MYITQKQATTIIRQWFPFIVTGDVDTRVSLEWLLSILSSIRYHQSELLSEPSTDPILESDIYKDVLYRIKSLYYYQTWINHTWLLHWAVRGLVDALDDPHTAFFPPTEAHSFTDQLEWQFYGIGAYVEMIEPWFFVITATIDWSPAQNSGLRAGDRIVQVDDHFIESKTSSDQAVSWIKWPAGTKVSLKYIRDWKIFSLELTRAKIVVPNIEGSVYTSWKFPVCVIRLRMFDFGVASQFSKLLWELSLNDCTKYVFDLRNNPWWSLQEVSSMLDYFVPTWERVVSVKSKLGEQTYFASTPKYSKLTGELIRILVNWGSASASEIFAWVIREYIPNSLLVGQKTYGKWSVQNIVYYDDGSLLKYTVAKRYTGKKDITIDWIWFTPDVIIEDSVGTGKDAALDRALKN